MSKDKFECLEDLVYAIIDVLQMEFDTQRRAGLRSRLDTVWDNYLKWKEKAEPASKQPKEPERIEITDIPPFSKAYSPAYVGKKTFWWHTTFYCNKEIFDDKLPAIKTAIEQVLNDDEGNFTWEYWYNEFIQSHKRLVKYIEEREKDLEDAFNAGRQTFDTKPVRFSVFSASFPTFQSYLNTLNSK